jgi:hypothetical protein
LAVRQAKASKRQSRRWSEARRELEFELQRKLPRNHAGDFVSNWYPDGQDGLNKDPHYGETSPEAPYGVHDETGQPRTEPLYDEYGNPIIPRETHFMRSGQQLKQDEKENREKVKKALEEWGRYGGKKRYLEENPGATEEDWKEFDKERKKQREMAKKMQEAEEEYFYQNPDATKEDWERQKREERVVEEAKSRIKKTPEAKKKASGGENTGGMGKTHGQGAGGRGKASGQLAGQRTVIGDR